MANDKTKTTIVDDFSFNAEIDYILSSAPRAGIPTYRTVLTNIDGKVPAGVDISRGVRTFDNPEGMSGVIKVIGTHAETDGKPMFYDDGNPVINYRLGSSPNAKLDRAMELAKKHGVNLAK